ncbi:MAG TPA: nuclear transport factor 2 family protein [Yinghuangia sp.]|uniref:nuclear transport factor 2 family protein n=1 Tax=Yinghuangia sp. YIM S10712 TaxID=3436930 RepID=UPI002C025A3D|nr:nuclear transport factor 2 family protein [Yinghuangia sp.]
MSIRQEQLSDPAVRALVEAVNANDREAFLAVLTADATMSDDGSDRDLHQWIDKEIFSAGGRMDIQDESDGGRALTVLFTNDTWGTMRTRWKFVVDGRRITRFETGQA